MNWEKRADVRPVNHHSHDRFEYCSSESPGGRQMSMMASSIDTTARHRASSWRDIWFKLWVHERWGRSDRFLHGTQTRSSGLERKFGTSGRWALVAVWRSSLYGSSLAPKIHFSLMDAPRSGRCPSSSSWWWLTSPSRQEAEEEAVWQSPRRNAHEAKEEEESRGGDEARRAREEVAHLTIRTSPDLHIARARQGPRANQPSRPRPRPASSPTA